MVSAAWLVLLPTSCGSEGWCAREERFFCSSRRGFVTVSAASVSASGCSGPASAPSNIELTEFLAESDQKLLPSLCFRSNTTEAFFCSLVFSASSPPEPEHMNNPNYQDDRLSVLQQKEGND